MLIDRYRRGEKNPALNFNQFFELYSTENFATGGSAGQLVQPNADGSRPGYSGKDLITFKQLAELDLPYSESTLSNVFSSPDRNKNLKKLFKDNGFKVVSKGPRNTLLFNRPSAGQIDNLWQDTIKLVESGKATIPDKMRIPFKNEVLKVFNELKKTNTPFTTSDIYYKVVENVGDNKRIFIPKKLKGDTRVPGESIKVALGKDNAKLLLDGNIARIEKTTANRKKMFDLLLKGETDVISLAKDLGISKKDVYAEANKLFDDSYRYTANLVRKTGAGDGFGYLKGYGESDFKTVLKNLRNSGFEKLDERSARALIYNAYGDKNSVNYSPKKFDASLKKLKEYNTINAELRNTFGKGFQLDHTLSFKALKDLGNTTPENLIRLNPLPENINKMKVAFDRSYNNIITQLRDGNISPNISKNLLEKKKLIEDISTKTNIGSFKVDSSGRKILSFGADPFLKTDIPSQMLKNVDVQNRLVDVLKDYSDEDLKKITKKKSFESLRNLKKIPKKEMSRLRDVINDAVGELACGNKLASGGRIKFSSGSSCNVRGRKILKDAMRNGISSIEPSKQNLVKKILSGGANLVKGALDIKEFFKLKNLIGFPAAVAAFVYDTVVVADDMIRKGQPFDEAAGNEMLAGMLNLQPQVQEAKRVLADPKSSLSPAAKKYAEMLVDIGEYNNTLQTKNIPMKTVGMPGDPKEQKMLEKKLDALDKKISGTSTSGELDYLKEITERDAKDKAGRYIGEPISSKGGPMYAKDGDGNLVKVNEYGYGRTGLKDFFGDAPDKTDAPSFFSGQLKPSYGDLKQEPGKLPEYETKMIPAYVSQNYKTMEEQPITKDWLNVITQIKREQGELGANQNLDDIKYMNERFIKNNEGVPTKQKVKGLSMLDEMQLQNKWMQALSQPGIKGTQFSEGGITGLRSKYEYKK